MTQLQSAYLRHPHLHGDLVTFVAEDDIWLAPVEGGPAWRLTADQVPVSRPRLSPDGRFIAWMSTRDGAPEIHVAPTDGGASRRLTYWGNDFTTLRGWTPDGRPIATSTIGEGSIRRSWAYAIPLDGGEPSRLPYGPVGGLAFEPDGERSPLSAPGAAVRAGDASSRSTAARSTPSPGRPLLAGTADQPVELTVVGKDGTDERHPVIVPLGRHSAAPRVRGVSCT